MLSRRKFIEKTAAFTAVAPFIPTDQVLSGSSEFQYEQTETHSLCGKWRFRFDPLMVGIQEKWFASDAVSAPWHDVLVPHTWQIGPTNTDYRGTAWYSREFEVGPPRPTSCVRIEFEAVFHSATVWVNGHLVGDHLRKGYTAFTVDISSEIRWASLNRVTVKVDCARAAFNILSAVSLVVTQMERSE